MTTARSALKATGLRKSFGDQLVLDGIDLDIAEGTRALRRPATSPCP